MKTALITGITGQDGRHLTEFLLSKDYKVIGICRDAKSERAYKFKIAHPEVLIISRPESIESIRAEVIDRYMPNEIYNLSAFSSVSASFENPVEAANETGIWAIKMFEACRLSKVSGIVRVYQAGSSEMFGVPTQSPQTETTPFHPVSPYGAAKAFAHNIAIQYREVYDLQISNGILYNHEGPYRSADFVSRKITSNVAKIKNREIFKFRLGNIEGRRDWGYAGDYVKAMHLMLQTETANDFIISTGKSHTVRDFLRLALDKAGLKNEIEAYVDIDPKLQRPADSAVLVGDNSKALQILGWKPATSFEELVELMLNYDLEQLDG